MKTTADRDAVQVKEEAISFRDLERGVEEPYLNSGLKVLFAECRVQEIEEEISAKKQITALK